MTKFGQFWGPDPYFWPLFDQIWPLFDQIWGPEGSILDPKGGVHGFHTFVCGLGGPGVNLGLSRAKVGAKFGGWTASELKLGLFIPRASGTLLEL